MYIKKKNQIYSAFSLNQSLNTHMNNKTEVMDQPLLIPMEGGTTPQLSPSPQCLSQGPQKGRLELYVLGACVMSSTGWGGPSFITVCTVRLSGV